MATRKESVVHRQLKTLFSVGATRELTDGQLLERFATGRGRGAELAFAALVDRHGAMVHRVCHAQLGDSHDAQDAFQATFLVLIEKARGLWVHDSLGPWLHQVAFRTAACARSNAARRKRHERRAAELATSSDEQAEAGHPEWARWLHEEINRLPERYRVPIVLCDLEGQSCEEAARTLGRPIGTVKSWRARGRARLRSRLVRLGAASPLANLEAAFAADAAGPASRESAGEEALRTAVRTLSDWTMAGEVPASVRILIKGVMKTMILSKLRTTAVTVFALAIMATGFGSIARVAADDAKGPKDDGHREAPKASAPTASGKSERAANDVWPMTLREAILIGLENSEVVRVISTGTRNQPVGGFEKPNPDDRRGEVPFEITQAKPTGDVHRFRAEIMAHIRSVEQQYWSLLQQQAQLQATERAVAYAKDILKREKDELKNGRGTVADVAECTQRLEQFQLDLVTKTSDVITTERQLRNLLGIQPSFGRQIIPTTPPVVTPTTPDWNESVRTMLANQPDIVRASDELKDFDADYAAKVIQRYTRQFTNPPPDTKAKSDKDVDDTEVPSVQAKARKYVYAEAIHQYTHILARFFLEIDANYKQYQTASRLREAAKQRLEAQKSFYEEGRITIDRLLDATSQYALALATEAQYKTNYNISITALEEAKGTLLEFDNIKLTQAPGSPGPKADSTVRTASLEPPTIKAALPPPTLARSDAATAVSPAPTALPKPVEGTPEVGQSRHSRSGKTYSFHFSVNLGEKPIEVKGSFTVSPSSADESSKMP